MTRDEQIEQKLSLRGRKRRENARLSGRPFGMDAGAQIFALRREPQQARAPIGAVDAAIDQAEALDLIDQLAHARAFEPKPRGKAVLIDAGFAGLLAERRPAQPGAAA